MKIKIFLPLFTFLIISCQKEVLLENVTERTPKDILEEAYHQEINETEFPNSQKVYKTNPKKLYVHYMPWFHNMETDNYWGQHWTMTNRNPDNVDSEGKHDIASHYYPLIGPYSSLDPDLQEYHLLLIKIAGIDGVIFDWYGSRNIHDYNALKINTEAFIREIEEVGLEFAIMYEDKVTAYQVEEKTAGSAEEAAAQDMLYIQDTYFSSDNYIRIDDKELLFIFGPHNITSASSWDFILGQLVNIPKLITLWEASDRVGEHSYGEFSWVDKNHVETLFHYYEYAEYNNIPTIGGAYPGFNDYYYEGGWRSSEDYDWIIEHQNTETLVETLNLTHDRPVEFIQILTWNDFGEGTMIEPTLEFGYSLLEELQEYTGVPFTKDDLELPYRLYQLRKKHKDDQKLQAILNRVYKSIFTLDMSKADKLLSVIERDYSI